MCCTRHSGQWFLTFLERSHQTGVLWEWVELSNNSKLTVPIHKLLLYMNTFIVNHACRKGDVNLKMRPYNVARTFKLQCRYCQKYISCRILNSTKGHPDQLVCVQWHCPLNNMHKLNMAVK